MGTLSQIYPAKVLFSQLVNIYDLGDIYKHIHIIITNAKGSTTLFWLFWEMHVMKYLLLVVYAFQATPTICDLTQSSIIKKQNICVHFIVQW